jgi:cell division GTPase FtsZ
MEYSSQGIKSSNLTEIERQLVPELYGDVFLGFAGLGGRTTSIISPYVLGIARRQFIPSIFSVSLPFSVESGERVRMARETLDSIMKGASLTLIYSNDHLSEIARDMPIMKSFSLMNSIIWLPIDDLFHLMTREDLDVFFDEVSGKVGFFGMGTGSGREKERRATGEALRGPWIRDALKMQPDTGIAILRTASPEMADMQTVAQEIGEKTTVKRLMMGTLQDGRLEPGKARLSLILMK